MSIPQIMHESWEGLSEILTSDSMVALNHTLGKMNEDDYYPRKEHIFRIFQVPVNKIRVVILGQDPYPTGKGIGRAFAIKEGDNNPPFSLTAIEEEVGSPIDYTLDSWEQQGVFLLNAALTVERNKSASHSELWKPFTKFVIEYISQQKPAFWLLWGKKAQAFTNHIHNHVVIPNDFSGNDIQQYFGKSVVLKAAHPAAEYYSKGKAGFYGCKHFEIINRFFGHTPIQWSVPNTVQI